MNKKLPKYLKRIQTFYNPLADLTEEEETDDSDEMAVSAVDVERLLKKYSQTKSKLHALEPSTFGGTVNENARQWIQKFCNYATLNKIEEKEKILVFETLLTNSAQCWYENLEDQHKNKWDDLLKAFKETYFNSNSWFNSQRVENRKLRPGESCTTYINNLIELSQLSGLTDVELSKAIIRGLPDKLKFQVISHNPKTLDETVQRILLSESMMPANNGEDSMLCSLEDRVITSKLDSFTTKLTSTLDEIEKSFKSLKDSATNYSKPNKQIFVRCGICNRTNHVEDDCYLKQQNNRQMFRPSQSNNYRRPFRRDFQQRRFQQGRYNYNHRQSQFPQNNVPQMEYYTPPMPMQQFNRGRQQYQQEDRYPKNGDGAQA